MDGRCLGQKRKKETPVLNLLTGAGSAGKEMVELVDVSRPARPTGL